MDNRPYIIVLQNFLSFLIIGLILSQPEKTFSGTCRALDKREYLMIIFLISHRNHMM